MARVLLGPMVSDARGKQGGLVFSRNSAGHYTRAKISPVQPRTAAQIAVRANITNLSQAWRDTLTTAQRELWNLYAQASPVIDRFGNKATVSGLNMFLRFNEEWVRSGKARVDAAPGTPGEFSFPIVTLDAATATGLRVTGITPAVAVDDIIVLYVASSAASQARNFFAGPFIYNIHLESTDVPPVTIKPPASMAIGQRWFVRARNYQHDGRVSPGWKGYADVIA